MQMSRKFEKKRVFRSGTESKLVRVHPQSRGSERLQGPGPRGPPVLGEGGVPVGGFGLVSGRLCLGKCVPEGCVS